MVKPKDVKWCNNCGKKLSGKYFKTTPDKDGNIGYVCSKECLKDMESRRRKRMQSKKK